MPKRQLIAAGDVRRAAKEGRACIDGIATDAIVTAEARTVAADLRVELQFVKSAAATGDEPDPIPAIRRAVEALVRDPAQQDAVTAEVARRVAALRESAIPTSPQGSIQRLMLPPSKLIESCQAWARRHPARVVFPDGVDLRAVTAARELSRNGWAKPVLLGDPDAIRKLCTDRGAGAPDVPMIDPATSTTVVRYVEELLRRRSELTPEQAREQLRDPLWYAAAMLACGHADYCVAGNLSPTAAVLKAALKVVGLQEGMKTLSSMFFMIPRDDGPVLGFGDCGVVPEPTKEQLADIAIITARNYQAVTAQVPRVAMLSFSTLGSAKHGSAEMVRDAAALARSRAPDLSIDGELQFDAAFVPHIGAQKAPGSDVAGKANVFVFPSLAAGNIAYKVAERLGGYTALGPMIQGLRLPMHDLSRGCSAEDMVQVTLLAMKMSPSASEFQVGTSRRNDGAGREAKPLAT